MRLFSKFIIRTLHTSAFTHNPSIGMTYLINASLNYPMGFGSWGCQLELNEKPVTVSLRFESWFLGS
jgi:hypothetical protein